MNLTPRAPLIVVGALGALLLVSGCSSGGSDSAGVSTADTAGGAEASAEVAPDGSSADRVRATKQGRPEQEAIERAVISTGAVGLRSDDVATAREDVRTLLAEYDGEVADERTTSDRDGTTASARMVLRVPSKDFAAVLTALEDVAEVTSSETTSEDVTTQVIDNRARIRAQERSIARITQLLDRAQDIADIVRIEGELTRRQADLDSLAQQQAYLTDEVSLSTITVRIEQTDEKPAAAEPDEDGFLAGLSIGWSGLVTGVTGLATLAGVLLPFGLTLALVGVPLWWVRRLIRDRGRARRPAAPAA